MIRLQRSEPRVSAFRYMGRVSFRVELRETSLTCWTASEKARHVTEGARFWMAVSKRKQGGRWDLYAEILAEDMEMPLNRAQVVREGPKRERRVERS